MRDLDLLYQFSALLAMRVSGIRETGKISKRKVVCFNLPNILPDLGNIIICIMYISMTQLLLHPFTHLTGPSFRVKAKLLPNEFLLGVV